MAILESAANSMLMGMPKQIPVPAQQNEESIIELMGRECVRQFFEVVRINPNLCRVFYDPQVSFHYHKIASQTDFASDGQYMYSGKENVVRALHDLDFVDASVDLLLVRSLEVNLPSLFASVNGNNNEYESSSATAGSVDTKHLLSTSVHGVLQTKSLGHYRIFMTMTTLVTGGHFKILTQSLILWELSAAPPALGGVVLPSGSPYEYELAAAAAAAFGLQAAHTPFMPSPSQHQHHQQQQHLVLNEFQPADNNVPNAAGMLRQQQPETTNVTGSFDNAAYNNASPSSDVHQQHRPTAAATSDIAAAPAGQQQSDSQAAAAPSNNSDINNSARISRNIVSPHMPSNSTLPEFVSSSSVANTVAPSANFGQSAAGQQPPSTAHFTSSTSRNVVGHTPVDGADSNGSSYDTAAVAQNALSTEQRQSVPQQQQHDPYSNFKQQHLQQLNSANDEGYASSLQNADVNGDTAPTPTNAMQFVGNAASQPPAGSGQMHGQQQSYSMMMSAPLTPIANGPPSTMQHQAMKPYSAAFGNSQHQPPPMAPPPLSYGASLQQQHPNDMLTNGGMSSYDQQPAYRGYYSSEQHGGGYGGNYRGNRGNFGSRGGFNRSFNRDGNFRGRGDRNFSNNNDRSGGTGGGPGNRNRDGGPFVGRNYNSNNTSYADQQQSNGSSYNNNVYNNNTGQRGGRGKPGADQSTNSTAVNSSSDYRSSQPSASQQSSGAAVPNGGGGGGSPAGSSRQSSAAVAAGAGPRPSR